MTPFEITLAISILMLGGYSASGILNFGKSKSYDSFFLNDRKLTSENVRNTFTGAAISISTVLIFFLTLSPVFGWQIFLSPITLAFGVIFFGHKIYPRLMSYPGLYEALRGESDKPIDSLGDLVNFLYDRKSLAILVTAISGLGVLCVLVAELMVGVSIYEQYFVKPEYIVFLIGATLFLYAGLGGMRSVVQTDRWQVRLILLSLALIVIALTLQGANGDSGPASKMWFGSWKPAAEMPLALIVNMVVVNLCLLPASLRVWQVVAGSSKGEGFKRALWFSTITIAWILVCAVFVSRGVSARSPEVVVDLRAIFSYLSENGNFLIAYFVYPLFIAALLSAMVSTADSAILPLAQIFSRKDSSWKHSNVIKVVGILLIVVILFYFFVTKVAKFNIVQWVLTVLSVTMCIAPAIIGPLFYRRRYSDKAVLVISIGVGVGCLSALVWSFAFRDISIQPWNCAIGTGVSLFAVVIASFMKEDGKRKEINQSNHNDLAD